MLVLISCQLSVISFKLLAFHFPLLTFHFPLLTFRFLLSIPFSPLLVDGGLPRIGNPNGRSSEERRSDHRQGVGVGFFLFHSCAAGIEYLSIAYDIEDIIDEHFANAVLAVAVTSYILNICWSLLDR